eukprot:m.114007 g.114007  ORF g.114007 m.114007 type:complete len:62 (+) comp28317_c0_seq1:210-395(+)
MYMRVCVYEFEFEGHIYGFQAWILGFVVLYGTYCASVPVTFSTYLVCQACFGGVGTSSVIL